MSKRDQRGHVVVFVAIILFVLLSFAAAAVDIGFATTARTSAQRAADAAALAGAFSFVVDPTAPQPATAESHAIATATNNKILGNTIAAGDVTVNVDVGDRRVTVRVNHTEDTFFASVFGQNTTSIAATGIAEAAASATGTGCLKPFFIPNSVLFQGGTGTTQCDACGTGQLLVESDGSGGYRVTNWATQQIAAGTNQFSLKPNDPAQALRPGDFFLIDVPGTNPGDLPNTIAQCIGANSFCGNDMSVLTGNHVGPTNQGIEALVGCPTNLDTYLGVGQYQAPNQGAISDTSKQLVSCPVWDVCNATVNGEPFCPTAKVPGGTQFSLKIVGYALVFVEGMTNGSGGTPGCNGSTAVARVINVAACPGGGSSGGGIDPTETGPFGFPVRLVRVP